MRVALLVLRVGDDDLRPGAANHRHQASDRLVERRRREAARIGVGGAAGHAGIPVAEQDHLVVADDPGGPVELLPADLGETVHGRRAGPWPG